MQSVWEPSGCALQYRSINEGVNCMSDIKDKTQRVPFILFVGDSRIQQLRDGMILSLTGDDYDALSSIFALKSPAAYAKYGASQSVYQFIGAQIKFIWEPYLDDGTGSMTQLLRNISRAEFQPDLLVIGAGMYSIKDCATENEKQRDCAERYQKQFKGLLPLLEKLAVTTDVIWVPQFAVKENVIAVKSRSADYTNKNMQLYNNMIREVLASQTTSGVIFWESAWEVSLQINDGIDGIHIGLQTKHHLAQMLLDWLCSPVRREPTSFMNAKVVFGRRQLTYCCAQ
ncbi:hypothetical protein BV898_14888 [Hypsibius exemplaris]|uniref:Uncharacterized protein n=1 Tax=Hypsibius exemplaris TaxID=2072580 RepID=A0A9X6NBI1_HYPEX|nr:hypothetical protein BV898_14888 [Hypsibius exemplaris]